MDAKELIAEVQKLEDIMNGKELNNLLKELTTGLYYLETIRTTAQKHYEGIIHNKVNEGFSVARATNQANVEIPEMYKLRRILESGYRVVDSMRTNISFIKSELHNTAY